MDLESLGNWIGSGLVVRLVSGLVIIAGAVAIERVMHFWLQRLRRRSNNDASRILYVIEKVGGYIIVLAGLMVGLSTLGLNLESFSLFAGALGVGAGLGLQGIVREFFSGLVLIFNPDVRVGDFVELEGGVRGEIVEIGTRSTRLKTNDDVYIVIPNSTMIQSRVTNWTFSTAPRRLHVPFKVAAETDKSKVRDVVLKAARALPFSLPDTERHKTQVWLVGFAGAGLDFELIVWPDPESCRHPAAMHGAYTWAIHDALSAAGIENSTPQIDMRLQDVPRRESERALRALHAPESRRPVARSSPQPVRAPNDAAKAVLDDAERQAEDRETKAAGREPAAAQDTPPRH